MFTPKNSNNFMLVTFCAGLVAQFVLIVVITTMVVLDPAFNPMGFMPVWALILVSQGLTFGVPCVIYLIIHRRRIKELLPFRRLGWLNVVMIVGMTLAVMPLFMLVNLVSQFVFPNVIGETIMEVMQDGLMLTLIIVAVVPSIFEEVAFRGIGFAGFKGVKVGAAALINGLIFGMVHMNMNQFIYAFMLGVVFCYFMYYTKSLWAPILAHFVVNGIMSLIQYTAIALDPATLYAAAEVEMTSPEMLLTIVFFVFISIFTTGAFIAIFVYFKRYNIRRNDAAGIVTDTAAAALAEGHERPKAFTAAFWVVVGLFAAMMAMNYLLPVIL
ncbi:MAG: CPBP family intramembrane metalloprotease [Defluviitaleaceae bacterium]|nr:CPBP family intramembrane metalloprotease [Defluviitaleaceae bacterium]